MVDETGSMMAWVAASQGSDQSAKNKRRGAPLAEEETRNFSVFAGAARSKPERK